MWIVYAVGADGTRRFVFRALHSDNEPHSSSSSQAQTGASVIRRCTQMKRTHGFTLIETLGRHRDHSVLAAILFPSSLGHAERPSAQCLFQPEPDSKSMKMSLSDWQGQLPNHRPFVPGTTTVSQINQPAK